MFFTRTDNQWKYKSSNSLKQLKIGVIKSYFYGINIDKFQKEHSENFIVVNENNALEKLFKLLKEGDIDVLIDDSSVVDYQLKSSTHINKIRNAGCQIEADVYIAFSPDAKYKEKTKILLKIYNTQLLQLMKSHQLKDIFNAYR